MYGMRNAIDNKGQFVISLDFELHWGVWDVTSIEKYGANIIGVQKVIPRLIEVFDAYDIKATFATVGFLFAKNKAALMASLPAQLPGYTNRNYNVYEKVLPSIGCDEKEDPYHFGFSLLEQLKQSKHEIASHSFSHYYCLEEGQTEEDFEADVVAAINIAKKNALTLQSFVFPRNQTNEAYLQILHKHGFNNYRGNPTSWIYAPRRFRAEVPFIRLCRLLDTYIPISGYNTHKIIKAEGIPVNVPASRFLKPYVPQLRLFEKLRMNRIKKEMTVAAQKNQLYHLWWHPHNFGINLEENIIFLSSLLDHYKKLNQTYGFSNFTMQELAMNAKNSH
jgi:peptidoglycan/xylan/chitin deacetylase (PgdA/CDA1 family)